MRNVFWVDINEGKDIEYQVLIRKIIGHLVLTRSRKLIQKDKKRKTKYGCQRN